MIKIIQNFLINRLKKPLPGRKAHLKMVPEPLNEQAVQRPMNPLPESNSSSVLILFFPNEQNEVSLIFTVRNSDINHGGQISFPGGRAEDDESTVETAMREAQEEIGIDPDDVRVAGLMSDLFVSVSNNLVTPVIGFIDYKPAFKRDPAEVDEVFTVPLPELLEEKNMMNEQWELHPGASYKVPFWKVHEVPLWGATAMILSELMELYREFILQNTNGN